LSIDFLPIRKCKPNTASNNQPKVPLVAKTLAGVLAVSIAALLFAGCGGGSPLSPAQKEVCDQLNSKKKELESQLKKSEEFYANNPHNRVDKQRDLKNRESALNYNLRQRADAGC